MIINEKIEMRIKELHKSASFSNALADKLKNLLERISICQSSLNYLLKNKDDMALNCIILNRITEPGVTVVFDSDFIGEATLRILKNNMIDDFEKQLLVFEQELNQY